MYPSTCVDVPFPCVLYSLDICCNQSVGVGGGTKERSWGSLGARADPWIGPGAAAKREHATDGVCDTQSYLIRYIIP